MIVNAKNIKKSYKIGDGSVTALQEIDLTISSGELIAIMGASGSGKSTLMHILGCLEKPDQGSLSVCDQDVFNLNDKQLAALRASQIGFVFQSFNLIPQLNVLENVQLSFFYHDQTDLSEKEKIYSAIKRVGLEQRIQHFPNQLSGGEIQRVSIARALAKNPLLILADEPTGNLDHKTGCSILSLFQELHSQGSTIVIVTHDPFVAKHCKRVIKMADGLIIEDSCQLT